ncbi:Demethylmenaquinone methyltransferase [Pirellulimonas nuda]|uniref:Demethylmenaquinone methyltransferase n=1 Tax=Pirellulimonas nuda TaxID=2528009 RepID=A0A518D5P4_9BACT|nr:methyltransferase domain-containing protein [Pirellulimonas nuda]QDU86793.1 Demethylmenaquinone methyltransferase [Pirellulimonas nuda]
MTITRSVAVLLACSLCAAALAKAPADGVYLGREIARTMHFAGAPWLVRNSREREEEPARLLSALGVRRGDVVCDLGCGNGFYSLLLAGLAAPGGEVIAVDIQPEMLDLLRERAEARGVTNIRRVLGGEADPKLPAGEIDLVLMVDVYHELSDPAAMLAAVRASLKPTGRVALVEFRAEDPAVPIKPLHKMTQAQCVREFTANQYKPVGQFDGLPWQHVLFFARDDSPLEGVEIKPWEGGDD